MIIFNTIWLNRVVCAVPSFFQVGLFSDLVIYINFHCLLEAFKLLSCLCIDFWIYVLEKLDALMEVALYGILRQGVLPRS